LRDIYDFDAPFINLLTYLRQTSTSGQTSAEDRLADFDNKDATAAAAVNAASPNTNYYTLRQTKE